MQAKIQQEMIFVYQISLSRHSAEHRPMRSSIDAEFAIGVLKMHAQFQLDVSYLHGWSALKRCRSKQLVAPIMLSRPIVSSQENARPTLFHQRMAILRNFDLLITT